MNKGLLVVVSGPAGSGKGTVNALLLKDSSYVYSVSATTRAPRPGEIDGVNYHFMSRDDFKKRLDEDELLEHTEYCGNYYGTLKKESMEVLESGKNLILEIEVDGAKNVKRLFPEAILIMLLPPNFETQEQRLRDRGTETEEKILARLEQTKVELSNLDCYDYIVYNYDNETEAAADDIRAIVRAELHAQKRQPNAKNDYFVK